ncbi:hypothetical protein niasHT_021722 [Heterodera trifolii]|uniref:UPAR/Ly6 domain-containing protein n=1 Tax=Heterodera trifolii TaxID=157864 RepID=A0ABD2KS39_9BILA
MPFFNRRQIVLRFRKFTFPLLCIAFFFAFHSSADGLSCYQGLANLSAPVSGSATQCVGVSLACVKTVDFNSGQVTRSCLATNCTVQAPQGQMAYNQQATSSGAICINNTASTFCCCYGDGCNSALSPAVGGTMTSLLRYSIPLAMLLMIGRVLY